MSPCLDSFRAARTAVPHHRSYRTMPGTPSRHPRWLKFKRIGRAGSIFLAVVHRKEELVAMPSRRGYRVLVGWPAAIALCGEFVRLKPITCHRQWALVPLHGGHGRGHVVNDGANVGQLFLDGLGFRWWRSRHGNRWRWTQGARRWWWWDCAAAVVEKLALNTNMLWLGRLGLKSKVTPSQLRQNQFLPALFIDSSALYSRLIQSLV
jgi:hypothetical protein